MQQSSDKENRKVQTDKQFDDNKVREGKPDSINDTDNKSANSYKRSDDKEQRNQEKQH